MGCPYGQGDAPQELDRVRALGYRCGAVFLKKKTKKIYRFFILKTRPAQLASEGCAVLTAVNGRAALDILG